VVKRFEHIWHTGNEQFTGFVEVANFDDYIITVQNSENIEKIKVEIDKIVYNFINL